MISPERFREFVIPSFRKQIAGLDYTLFHMDGKEAVRHLEALMELEGLDALQWTPNAGMPDSGWEEWYPIYDKVLDTGKGLWISIWQGSVDDIIEKSRRIVKRCGSKGIYFHYPDLPNADVERLYRAGMNNFR